MGVSYDKVVAASMALRSVEPALWEQFVSATGEFAAQVLMDTMRAPPELLARAQGMAIQADSFASTLANAPKLYEDRQRTMGQKHARQQLKQPI